MRAEFWAVLTAGCWAFGSILEKRGLKLGEMPPVLGAGLRTAVSLVILAALSWRFWPQLRTCGLKPILLVAVGGALLAGALGLVCLYSGLKSGAHIGVVMTIAFCLAPVIGAVTAWLAMNEKLTWPQAVGIGLCVVGAAMTMLFKAG